MAQPYIGEIRMFGGNFAPVGWAFCDGQVLPIAEFDALFTLIGTTFGGNGEDTFALPNLQSRTPMHQGNGATLGEADGVEEVTLTIQQIPAHTHPLQASLSGGTGNSPQNSLLAQTTGGLFPYFEDAPTVAMASNAITPEGGSQPHTNLQPYLAVNFIISLFGIFPTQT